MALRGALDRGVNIILCAAIVLRCCVDLYGAYSRNVHGGAEPLLDCAAFLLGAAAGLPAYVMNRRALSELYPQLTGKLFLSSQLALLSSRHGKNAVAYFYLVAWGGVYVGDFSRSGSLMEASSFFAFAAYATAHLLPFVFPPGARQGS